MKPSKYFPEISEEELSELVKPELFAFWADPKVITPLNASVLFWQTNAKQRLEIGLPKGRREVDMAGSLPVRPTTTTTYTFWQSAGKASTMLGTAMVTVDRSQCQADALNGVDVLIRNWLERALSLLGKVEDKEAEHSDTKDWRFEQCIVTFEEGEITVEFDVSSPTQPTYYISTSTVFDLQIVDDQIKFNLIRSRTYIDPSGKEEPYPTVAEWVARTLRFFVKSINTMIPSGHRPISVRITVNEAGEGIIQWEYCKDPAARELSATEVKGILNRKEALAISGSRSHRSQQIANG
jgi:hypothetical protein